MSDDTQEPQAGSAALQTEEVVDRGLGIASLIYKATKEPPVSLHAFYQKKAALKRTLGEWANDRDKEDSTPVLREEKFLPYLLMHDGILPPKNPIKAKSGWAYFLSALGISPGMELVTWRPSTNSNTPRIDLEVDGAVLGHVINLFWINKRYVRNHTLLEKAETLRCTDLGFGKLSWDSK